MLLNIKSKILIEKLIIETRCVIYSISFKKLNDTILISRVYFKKEKDKIG